MTADQTVAAGSSPWPSRLGRWTFTLALAALAIAGIGLTLARYDVIPKLQGFLSLLGGGLLALIALLLALVGLLVGRTAAKPARGRLLAALLIGLLFTGFLATRPLAADDAPAIHDITTDLADPPQFETLPLRADNLAGVGSEETWKRLHAQGYPDLRPLILPGTVPEVTARVAAAARAAGWEVAAVDAAQGRVEATDSVSYIRFKDDIVLRVRPEGDGTRSRVDMRSVSRIGVSDMGVNAKRIRRFQAMLQSEADKAPG